MSNDISTEPLILNEQIGGEAIQVCISTSSGFKDCPEEVQENSLHLIATPVKSLTIDECHTKGIRRGLVIDLADRNEQLILQHFFPGVDTTTYGIRVEANNKYSAKMNTVHAHYECSPGENWGGVLRRCVDSLASSKKL